MKFSLKRFLKKSYLVRSAYWLTLLNWLDLAVMLSRKSRKRSSEKKRVAFVKMDGIGDYVIWSAVFDGLRDLYPSSEFERVLIGNDRFEQLAEIEQLFDEKIFVNLDRFAASPAYRYRTMRRVREMGTDTIINARSARDLLWSDSIVRCSGARQRIGGKGTGNLMGPIQSRLTERWYTELRRPAVHGEHELINYLKFFGFPVIVPSLGESKETIRPPELPTPFAVFFPGAQIWEKCWPSEKFARVANEIHKKYGMMPVFCGGPDDDYLADEINKASKSKHIDLIGKTSLSQLSSLIGGATLVVSNDTGAAHIAVKKGTPLVVIASGNEVGRYFPYPETAQGKVKVIQYPELCSGCREACVRSRWARGVKRPCIQTVTVEEVAAAADEVLSRVPSGN